MPIYMDRHDVSEDVTAENIAELHKKDLEIQYQFNCRKLTYWFDEKRKTVFCLIEAPNKHAVQLMHSQAHGQAPGRIIEVELNEVESFLGRISDPVEGGEVGLNIIRESALRTLVMIGFDDGAYRKTSLFDRRMSISDCMKVLSLVFIRFNGRIVRQNQNLFLVSFQSVSRAILCVLEVYAKLKELNDLSRSSSANLKTGISAGFPVSGGVEFFEEVENEAQMLYYISDSNIVLASGVKDLYEEENTDAYLEHDLFVALTPSDQKFLYPLMEFIAETWQNPYLKVDDLGKNLGYSKSKLYRKMVSLVGETPNNFIKNYRLRKALKRIGQHSGNIAEIAYETGFNSASYFSKCFLKKYGVLPSEYLRQAPG